MFLLHRIYQLVFDRDDYDANPDMREVDHIDRNHKNNEPCNFRWVTRVENNMNKGVQVKRTASVPHALDTTTFLEIDRKMFGSDGEIVLPCGKLRIEIEKPTDRDEYPRIMLGKQCGIHIVIAYLQNLTAYHKYRRNVTRM